MTVRTPIRFASVTTITRVCLEDSNDFMEITHDANPDALPPKIEYFAVADDGCTRQLAGHMQIEADNSTIMITPEYRRRGIASLLITTVMAHVRHQHPRVREWTITLFLDAWNTPASALLTSIGFREQEERDERGRTGFRIDF